MIELNNVTLGYNRHPAVHHVTADIQKGAFLALVGPNGAGKSTLLKGILGQLTPIEGRVSLIGISNKDISYLPQANRVDRQFPMSAAQFVACGLWHELGLFKQLKASHRQRIDEALIKVGLSGLENRPLDALSGGQFQRLLFARKIIQPSKLLLLDEPFNAVDEQTVNDLMQILIEEHNKGATIVAVVHNMALVKRYFPSAMLLARELLGYGNTADVLTPERLLQASQLDFKPTDTEVCTVHAHD